MQNRENSSNLLLWGSLILFIVAAVVVGVLMFNSTRRAVAQGNIPGLGEPVLLDHSTATQNPDLPGATEPVPTAPVPSGPPAKVWDKASRVTVLVMGLDYRDWENNDGPPRTDSMILLTIDPVSMKAGILNIPRDLWVRIPGFDSGRINTAYPLGIQYQYMGGGPGLAEKTVEDLLGVPIDYYAQIDFDAFVKFIDELNGITVDIKEPITIDPVGKYNTVTLQPGQQFFDGKMALAYVRARKGAGDDFGRAERQQEVIIAIRRRLFKLQLQLLPKAPKLYNDLAAGIHTNMSLDDAIQLGLLALQIDPATYDRGVIAPPEMVNFATTGDGQQVLIPIPSKISQLRDRIFANANVANPNLAGKDLNKLEDLQALMAQEAPRLAVLNGSGTAGLAKSTADYLAANGAAIVSTGDAPQPYPQTTLVVYVGKPYTLRYLSKLMNIQSPQIVLQYNPESTVDIEVIVGRDWASSNTLP